MSQESCTQLLFETFLGHILQNNKLKWMNYYSGSNSFLTTGEQLITLRQYVNAPQVCRAYRRGISHDMCTHGDIQCGFTLLYIK